MLLQAYMTLFLLWNTKEDILKMDGNQAQMSSFMPPKKK